MFSLCRVSYVMLQSGQRVGGGCLSDTYEQENGLVQGGVISPILFNIMISDIFDNIPVMQPVPCMPTTVRCGCRGGESCGW